MCCWAHQYLNKKLTIRLSSGANGFGNTSGEDFSSDDSNDYDDNAAEDFGTLINVPTENPRKSTMDKLMSSVENIQKSVNQLAAAVAVTPSPDLSIVTTSRRSVDIDSLIANRNEGSTSSNSSQNNGRKSKKSPTRKGKGCCLT